MAHFFVQPEEWSSSTRAAMLIGDEAKHCALVRRHEVGDKIQIIDGRGRRAVTRIELLGRTEVTLKIESVETIAPPSRPLILYQAIPKGDGMEWIVEKATELGVTKIVPLITERTIVRLKAADAEKKRQKWQRLALEACKQCGQPWLPDVMLPCTLQQAMDHSKDEMLRLVASLQPGAAELTAPLGHSAGSVAIAIGPEGDFSPAEYEAFAEHKWHPVSLGSLTLRCETAAIASVSILQHHLAMGAA